MSLIKACSFVAIRTCNLVDTVASGFRRRFDMDLQLVLGGMIGVSLAAASFMAINDRNLRPPVLLEALFLLVPIAIESPLCVKNRPVAPLYWHPLEVKQLLRCVCWSQIVCLSAAIFLPNKVSYAFWWLNGMYVSLGCNWGRKWLWMPDKDLKWAVLPTICYGIIYLCKHVSLFFAGRLPWDQIAEWFLFQATTIAIFWYAMIVFLSRLGVLDLARGVMRDLAEGMVQVEKK